MRERVVVAAHEGVGDYLADRFFRVLPPILPAEPHDDRAPLHVPADRSEGVVDHGRDRSVHRLVVEEPGAIGKRLPSDSGIGDEGDVELGEELLWVATQGQQPGECDRRSVRCVAGDPEQAQDLVVGCTGEQAATRRSKPPRERRDQSVLQVINRRAGHHEQLIERLAVRRHQDVDLVRAEHAVAVVSAQERAAFHPARLHVARLATRGQVVDHGHHHWRSIDLDDVDLSPDRRFELVGARRRKVGRQLRGVDRYGRKASRLIEPE